MIMSLGSPLDNQLERLDAQQCPVNQGPLLLFKQRMEVELQLEMTMTMIDIILSTYFKAIFIMNLYELHLKD